MSLTFGTGDVMNLAIHVGLLKRRWSLGLLNGESALFLGKL